MTLLKELPALEDTAEPPLNAHYRLDDFRVQSNVEFKLLVLPHVDLRDAELEVLLVEVHKVVHEVAHVLLRAEKSLGQENPIKLDELFIGEANIVTGAANANRFEHSGVTELERI